MNMLQTITPRSDQLNSDDLIGQTMTIRITDVRFKAGDEQPVAIHFDNDGGKPYKVCKSMRRVLVQVWGADAKQYVGRSMTLYRDPDVMFGGQKVGGIRISHMSHIDAPITMALTATRASRKPFTVKPLAVAAPPSDETINALLDRYESCDSTSSFAALEDERRKLWDNMSKADKTLIKSASDAASARLNTSI